MAKARSQYRCSECRHVTAKWVGRCLECGTWGSVDEVAVLSAVRSATRHRWSPPRPRFRSVPSSRIGTRHCPTGVDELDRVLGGGVVPGSVTLLAGDPGVGKSTLLLKVAHQWAASGRRALYVSGEESRGPDPDARRPDRLQPSRAISGRRVRPAGGAQPHRGGAAHAGRRRLGADHVQHGRRRRHRWGHPGAGGDHRADRRGENRPVCR